VIVRDRGDSWHVVLQIDHADLAGTVAEAWADRGPRHDSAVVAARRHDDGWAVWERSPLVDAAGSPVGFLDVHVPAHLAFYRAGIAAITDEDPYAGLLVSMHGAGIYRQRYGSDTGLGLSRAAEVQPLVDAFVAEQEGAFAERAAAVGVEDELRWADYHRLQWYDRFSLAFCLREWDDPDPTPFELGPYTFTPTGAWSARVDPYPFAGTQAGFTLVRRIVEKRPWRQEEFRRAFFELDATAAAITLSA
jgi:uncharacterized protein DUF3891